MDETTNVKSTVFLIHTGRKWGEKNKFLYLNKKLKKALIQRFFQLFKLLNYLIKEASHWTNN
ncbi:MULTISPECIES: hypothetical protein [Bacillus]|uniref:Uncharacterized protein n=1 Tax=Bacillus cereus TaxID=1396 RepID=A0A2C1LKI5_BACCE|nr:MULTISPECIES: hypothetical protein [Bacillus]MDH4421484.1 hypothetical protein [Bacillus cereus]PGT98976.1 hypothetical protein COD19_20710 [Bacillus cereus]PGZ75545.1 hypothetical protein COE49_05465 [Bacillus sp. AFS029637]